MDTVFIRDLRVETVVGIYDWERRIKQIVSLDLDMGTGIARAANSDRIEDTLDYKTVAKRVAQFVGEAEFQLVETLAEKVAALILEEFKVEKVKVTLHKPGAVSGSKSVGVIIERHSPPT
ncbi:MAG: dihydroneopterin aldolase [Gammaproteobacteria bacterium]